jgi:hypothetical protein
MSGNIETNIKKLWEFLETHPHGKLLLLIQVIDFVPPDELDKAVHFVERYLEQNPEPILPGEPFPAMPVGFELGQRKEGEQEPAAHKSQCSS